MSKSPSTAMTILIADDHPLFRNALIQTLQTTEYRSAKFLQAANGKEVVRFVREEEIDILLLDIQMPHMNGYETVEVVLHQRPKLKIIISSLIEAPDAIDHFFEKGVKGYVTKAANPEEFLEALQVVNAGGLYIQKDLSIFMPQKKIQPVNLKLSPQERQVLQHLSEGLNAARIGEAMGLSPRTVEDYKASMMKKAQVKNTAELVRFFYENGLN